MTSLDRESPEIRKQRKEKMRSFAAEVIADSSGKYYSNSLRFASKQEATNYVIDLMYRWTAVRDTRVVETNDPVSHTYTDRQLFAAGEE